MLPGRSSVEVPRYLSFNREVGRRKWGKGTCQEVPGVPTTFDRMWGIVT